MADVQPQGSWIVRSRRAFVALLILVLSLLAVRALADVLLGRRLEAEIARLEKQYGQLRYDPVRKKDAFKTWPRWTSPVNRARQMHAAAARITISDAHANLLHTSEAHFTATAEQVRAIADENRESVQLAIRAAQLRHYNWGATNLLELRYLSTVLAMAARRDTDAGRADDAVAAVMAGFAEAVAMRSEATHVQALYAMNVAFMHADVLKDVLNRAEPSGSALASLAAAIDENLAGHPARPTALAELRYSLASWPRVERGWFRIRADADGYALRPVAWTRGVAWLVRPVIRFRAMRELGDKSRALAAASAPPGQRAGMEPPPILAALIEIGDLSTASTGHAAIAVALRRFRLDYGSYPNALAELAPKYINTVPLDPFTGRPHQYERSGSGFTLRALLPAKFDYSKRAEWTTSR